MKYGLAEKQLEEIIDILSQYSEIEKAILFGSRAKGTYRPGSDVDIVLIGKKVDFSLAAKIKSHLEDDTYLPYFFDIVSYNTITSKELKEHLKIHGKIIYQRK